MGQPRPLFRLFSVFSNKQHYNSYNKNICGKNVHPVYCAGIQTHDLRNVCLFPLPLDQGSRPLNGEVIWQANDTSLSKELHA